MTSQTRSTVICAACGETRECHAHGWCHACYRRWRYYGRPAGGPPPVRLVAHEDVVGTVKGWDLHRRHKERACDACRKARNDAARARYVGSQTELAPCGTDGAYQRHLRQSEDPCQPCRNAHSTKQRERRHYSKAPSVWDPEQQRAALVTADRATGASDCRLLLEALGLIPSTAPRREHTRRAA